jgi:transposase
VTPPKFLLGGRKMATPTDLTDVQWEKIAPLLPPPKATGRPRADDRTTLNGILFVLRNGLRWQDLPERYGSPVTCWRRLSQWEQDGTWEKLWRTFLRELDEQGRLDWSQAFLDGSFVPAKKGAMRSVSRSAAKAPS